MHILMEKGAKNRVVPTVTEKSTFEELTKLLVYSFFEEDRELVEKILANREKGLIDELDKLRKKCDILEKERDGFEKRLNFELEKSRESEIMMKKKLVLVVNEKLKVEDVFEKYRSETEEKLREKVGNEFEKRLNFELEKEIDGFEKRLYFELEKSRENYENELKRDRDLMENNLLLVNLEKLRAEDEFRKYRSEMEEKLRGYYDVLEKVRNVFDNRLKFELEKSSEKFEKELKRESELMEKKLSFVLVEKLKVEDEFEKYRSNVEEKLRIVAKPDVIEKCLNLEEGKSRESYGMTLKRERDAMENKLSLALLEKGKMEDEFERYRTEMGDKIMILEREYGELKREIELHKEGDHEQAEKSLANQEKGLMGEAEGRQTEFQYRVEILGRENGELKRQIELHEESSCKRIKLEKKEVNQLKRDKGGVLDVIETGVSSPDLSSMYCSPKSRIPESHKSESRKGKETSWKTSADMLLKLRNDPELCMSAVCALYRQHISSEKSTDDIGFRPFDIASGTEAAKYLINNDPTNKLSRSASEVHKDRPSILETCWRLVIKYLKQLFVIYQKELDPFFCQKA